MKVSELTAGIIKDYCGISDNDSDDIIEKLLLPAARKYITGYTGLTAEQCDEHDDLAVACMVLVNDMFSQREYTISPGRQLSPTVRTILGMYSVNYL